MRNLSFSAQLLQECRDLAAQRLGTILPDLLDKVDDALFDMADKGENSTVQILYFGAMREVRLRRTKIEANFRIYLADAVNDRIRQASKATGDVPDLNDGDANVDSFGLVEDDDLEESLAVSNMAAKIRSACKGALFVLDKRMGFLLGDPELAAGNDPIGPEVICGAFKDACCCIEAEIEVKLLVLKLFDRFVVQEMEPLYDEINNHLVKREVLPNLKPAIDMRRNSAGTFPRSGASGQAAQGNAGPLMTGVVGGSGESLGDMGQHAGQSLLGALQTLMRAGGATLDSGGISIPSGEVSSSVIGALTTLQSHAQKPTGVMLGVTPSVADAADGEPLAFDLRSLKGAGFAELMGSAGTPVRPGTTSDSGVDLGPMNEMLIDIVAMMFDYILDDENLAPPMRALIARLQIPVLKVAILDRTLFSRRFHPTRKLLNAFAEAAFGWDESAGPEDALYQKMVELIDRILDEFDDKVAVFASVLESFEAFVEEEACERQRHIERQAAALVRRERLQEAKQVVRQEVRRALEGVTVPPIVKRFITRYWGGNLVVIHMKHGSHSQPWANAVETMDRLVWSVTPKEEPGERARLIELLPTLLKRVNDGVTKVSMPSDEREELVTVLSGRHAEIVRAPVQRVDNPNVVVQMAGEKGHEPPPISDEVALLFGDSEVAAATAKVAEDLRTPIEPNAVLPAHGQAPSEAVTGGIIDTPDDIDTGSPSAVDGVDHAAEPGPELDQETDRGKGGAFVYYEQDLLVRTIARANRLIYDAQLADSEKSGMGTTVVAAIFRDNLIHYAHVGDSRLYRLRNGHLIQLTRDHSLMQELIDKGVYTPEEAAEQVNRNLVTRGLGVEASVETDVAVVGVDVDDLFLLCSDGLTDMVEDCQIETLAKRYGSDPAQLVDMLIDLANENGGRDNISALVALVNKPFPLRKRWYVSKSISGKIHFAGRTDVGQRRSHNEDSIAIVPETGTLVVADGMGGLRAGEVASAMAVRALMQDLSNGVAELANGAENPNDVDLFSLGDSSRRAGDPVDAAPPVAEIHAASDDGSCAALDDKRDVITEKMLGLLDRVEIQAESIVSDQRMPPGASSEGDLSGGERLVHQGANSAVGGGGGSVNGHAFGEDDPDLLAFTQGLPMRSVASGDEGEDCDEYGRAAGELAVGNWVELELEPGKTSRARLSWFNQATGVYLFTDRRGLHVAERSLHGFAVELRRGSARILETVPLYDRAVTSLMDHLGNGTDGG